jgi:hypothetical protein
MLRHSAAAAWLESGVHINADLLGVSRAVRRLGGILEESPHLTDHHPITGVSWNIPWRLPEWADRQDLVLLDLHLS